MRMKKLAVMALATALSVGSVMTASAAWLQEGSNWRYQNDNGTFQTGTWFRDADGRWSHFDNNGIMQKGWFQDADGKWYFLAYNGVMQVGLIKVDNQVYYMGTSGDLFIGDMKIGNTTYNFGLYGTTNGQPSVPASATYGGNGNQSLNGGGGGSSSNGGGSTTTPTTEEKVAEAVNTLKEATKGIADVDNAVPNDDGSFDVQVDVTTTVTPETEKKVQSDVKKVIESTLKTVDSKENVVVSVAGFEDLDRSYTVKEWNEKLDNLVQKYITTDKQSLFGDTEVTVTAVIDGAEVTYTISLANN